MDVHHHHGHHHYQKQAKEKSADTKLHGPKDDHQEHQKSHPPPQSSSTSCSSSKQQVMISPASPPSASSSPSHEFSFTISLHSSSNPTSTTRTTNDNKKSIKSKTTSPSFAIDLSPADDIFFHGHLLPLHLLSHLPVSPRSSTNSLENFTLPIRDFSSSDDAKKPTKDGLKNSASTTTTITNTTTTTSTSQKTEPPTEASSRNKQAKSSSSFSLFGLGKWRRAYEFREREDKDQKPKKKLRFEVSHVLKRYIRMVRPLLFFGGGGRRRENSNSFHLRRQPYSFSGILSSRNNSNKDLRGRRRGGEYSAPASMRTSPSNSGLLVATATLPSSASDSTMEELQAAIQAAIAHCKNSINNAADDYKLKC